mmetsp:Transcript_34472/g.56372  ORF Transcript_34472/g.56372 Transcript_34472/m.56372 type:complete len:151 (+) Transcript_34472:746-1198(+)
MKIILIPPPPRQSPPTAIIIREAYEPIPQCPPRQPPPWGGTTRKHHPIINYSIIVAAALFSSCKNYFRTPQDAPDHGNRYCGTARAIPTLQPNEFLSPLNIFHSLPIFMGDESTISDIVIWSKTATLNRSKNKIIFGTYSNVISNAFFTV